MARYECGLCSYVYDEDDAGRVWSRLADDWACPVCGSPKSAFARVEGRDVAVEEPAPVKGEYLGEWRRAADDTEILMTDIHRMAETGEPIIEPMRTTAPNIGWDEILIKGAQLARIPLNEAVPVNTRTVIGPGAKHPLVIETPIYVTHMSFGALSMEAKISLARGSAAVRTAMCSGEGGIIEESVKLSHKYIFEYVPNRYSVTEENLRRVDAVEIKIGQSAKPGLGGHLPAEKVTREIAGIRGRNEGEEIISPAHFEDIRNRDELRAKVDRLRELSGGRPIGIKIAAGNIEDDLEIVLFAGPDFVTIDGRAGATAAAPKYVKSATSVPSVFALYRARKYLESKGRKDISVVITGGLRVSSDFAKALALGADAVAVGTAAMMALGCQQYRICNTGKCPVGITSHDPELRSRLDVERSAERVANYFRACTKELQAFARLTGNDDVHKLAVSDLCTLNTEISSHTSIEHV